MEERRGKEKDEKEKQEKGKERKEIENGDGQRKWRWPVFPLFRWWVKSSKSERQMMSEAPTPQRAIYSSQNLRLAQTQEAGCQVLSFLVKVKVLSIQKNFQGSH